MPISIERIGIAAEEEKMVNLRTMIASGAILLATALAPVHDAAAQISRSRCAGDRFSFTTSGLPFLTSSTTFVNIPGASVSFSIPGTTRACILVEFSAVAFTDPGETLRVLALLDGKTFGQPGDIPFTTESASQNAYSFQFAFVRVSPGRHTIQMQARSVGGKDVTVGQHTTAVHHR